MKQYEPKSIEPKWQQLWAETKLYEAKDGDISRPKYYMLTEFPYPSGAGLHAGHIREYTLGDVIARHKRMQGHNVLFPMGYDAFGLPTENYAIKNKLRPQDATATNVATFRKQFEAMGLSFDWDREVNTTDPAYYRWTQWLFLRFFKAGLAYQAEMPINWCPKEKTGLANEEVVDGKHERCGTPVEKKLLKQWMLKITDYADRLIDGLKDVDYPPRIADQQINWIGRSEGAEITFDVDHEKITVYTTRPDTLAGATFVVLAPEHPAVSKITKDDYKAKVAQYLKAAQSETDLNRQEENRPKTGVFTGAYAHNPITKGQMPVWVADYVLAGYGTGAIMAVPAHDERDNAFAKAFDLPIINVIDPVMIRDDARNQTDFEKRRSIVAVVENARGEILTIDWGPKLGGRLTIGGKIEGDDTASDTALREVAEETGYHDLEIVSVGDETVSYKYYAFSKKQAHDTAVTFVHVRLKSDARKEPRLDDSEKGKFVVEWVSREVAEKEISEPLHRYGLDKFIFGRSYAGEGLLVNSGQFDGLTSGEAKTAITTWLTEKEIGRRATKYRLRDWIFSRQHYWGEPIPIIHCQACGTVPVPDDQLPVKLPDVDHYEPTDTGQSPLAAVESWVNTTCPKCGGSAQRETDTMPNWAGSSWYYLRFMDPHNHKEFAGRDSLNYWGMVDLYLGGMEHTTLHLLYSRFWHQFLFDQGLVPTPEPYAARRGQGIVLAPDGRKMSKSLGNVVNPTDIIASYGADALRLYVLFMAPYDESTPWSDERLNGVSRFLHRVWNVAQDMSGGSYVMSDSVGYENSLGAFETEVDRATHKTIKKVHDALDGMR
ncbi:MAG TPA: class I tRNA ligase family protein, partial [Candidatus Saccharimonadia bacterium]|nr:class I tRNA ligase family protein [Candidatus Saccharimonadia bacterium]